MFGSRGTPDYSLGMFMNTYDVEFQSQFFKLKTDHDKVVFEALRSEVEKKLNEIQNSYKKISVEKALFLTCLHFAEDKLLLKRAIDENINSLESQAKDILADLESSSGGTKFEINL